MIITIDGPVATGKSTIAKKVAESLGFIFFDTGAMYRALTYGILKHGINLAQSDQLQAFLDQFHLDVKVLDGERRYWLENEDITQKIRQQDVTSAVSEVSAIQAVREKLVALQRQLSIGIHAVFEGRDMGTVVFPNAELKIFLTGRPEVRAQRRYDEMKAKYPQESQSLTLEQCLESLNQRDALDSSRACSPLRQAEDAYVVDTSDLTIDEVVAKILAYKNSLS